MNRRIILLVALLAIAVALLGGRIRSAYEDPTVWPPDDFVQYWCAGWFNLQGENPYDPVRMYRLEQEIGWDIGQAVMMWNPPWTLSLAMPLGFLPARAAQFAWLLVKIAILAYCADRLWRLYGGPTNRTWIAWLVSFAFFPTLVSLNLGQISPFMLLGATLFLVFVKSDRLYLAGAACVLIAVKPHLAYLFWLAVALDAVTMRRFAIVLGGIAGGVAASVWPLLENPAVFSQYFAAARSHPPEQWMSPTLGTLLRIAFGEDQFWLQFVSMAIGFVWFAYYWMKHRQDWVWSERLPWLLFVSFVTAPYGAWQYDIVLLLVPLVRLAARLASDGGEPGRLISVAGFVFVNLAMLAMNVAKVYSVWFIWVAPCLLLLAILIERQLNAEPLPQVQPA